MQGGFMGQTQGNNPNDGYQNYRGGPRFQRGRGGQRGGRGGMKQMGNYNREGGYPKYNNN